MIHKRVAAMDAGGGGRCDAAEDQPHIPPSPAYQGSYPLLSWMGRHLTKLNALSAYENEYIT